MKAKIILLFVVALAIVFFSQEFCFAQGEIDFNFIGAGARARGMGGAFIGGADDATAASWNPAGLVFLENPEASAVYVYSSVYQSIDDEEVEDLGLSHGYLNFASAALPLSIGERNVVGCIAYQRMIDLFNKSPQTLEDNFGNFYYYDTKTKGGVDAISPSIGIQISPQFSLGLAYNIYVGSTTTKWEYLATEEEVDAPKETYSGGNLSMGGMLDLGMFRIGAIYKTPYTLKAERDENLGGNLVDFFGYEFEMKMPAMFGIGVMVEPTPNLRLAADYELRGFSNFETRRTWTSADRTIFNRDEFEKADWVDVNQLRIGAEYLIISGDSVIPLRLGLKTEPKPYKDFNDDQIIGSALTMGLGLVSHVFSIGATLEYSALTLEFFDTEITTSQLNFLVSGIFYFGK